MATIQIEQQLADEIASLAEVEHTSPDRFVADALRSYISQRRREKIRAETETFEQQREQLRAAYGGDYIAMHQGQVIDHDTNLSTLQLRVYQKLGRTPVLLKRATDDPERELLFRSPRFEREATE